jgi:endonuclease/exonuclease/phosphatase (EEP) superfamily protein YafD
MGSDQLLLTVVFGILWKMDSYVGKFIQWFVFNAAMILSWSESRAGTQEQ